MTNAGLPEPEGPSRSAAASRFGTVEAFVLLNVAASCVLALSFSGVFEFFGLWPLVIDHALLWPLTAGLAIFDAVWLIGFALSRWLHRNFRPWLLGVFFTFAAFVVFGPLPTAITFDKLDRTGFDFPRNLNEGRVASSRPVDSGSPVDVPATRPGTQLPSAAPTVRVPEPATPASAPPAPSSAAAPTASAPDTTAPSDEPAPTGPPPASSLGAPAAAPSISVLPAAPSKTVSRPVSPTLAPLPGVSVPAPAQPSAYWNTWFEYQNDAAPEVLTEGNTYAFALDISPFEYAALRNTVARSSTVDPKIREKFADPANKQITFRIKPLLPEGGGLRFVTPDQSDVVLKANLPSIREPDDAAKQSYLAGKISLKDLSDKASAGNARFSVSAEEAGCAAVVLAVFSEDGRFPLDHLVRWVPIVKAGESPPDCKDEISGEQVQQYAGLDKLLQVSLELNAAGASKVANAAFHIFDSSAGSFVIFSDGRPAQQKTVYAWQTGDSLVRFVSDEHRLPKLIQSAREAVTLKKPASYVGAAQELATVLFGGQSPRDEKEAGLAKAAFLDIVAQSATRPVIVARVVADTRLGQNPSVFLPLGILGASGEGAVLTRPITVIQPLPRERYGSGATCVGDWTFGVPAKLERDDEDLSKLWPPDASGKNWFHDLAGLKAYLADSTPVGLQPGAGFLLLAHHGSGNLWFDNEAQRVIRQNVTREFPGGSVGVFAACSFATATYDASFVQRLNEHGVDTLIASPFPVPVEYGTRFALEFPKAIEEARKRFAKPTVSDLFAVAIELTADRLAGEFTKNYSEMGLEYVLLGSPNTPLCAKPATGADP